MGLYPIYGQTHYMLVPPLFERVKIKLSPGVRLNDQARIEDLPPSGDDAELIITTDTSLGKRYIIGATLDGNPLNRAWVRHGEIAHGAQIHLVLSDQPSDWGTREPPPNGIRRP
jgi:putative alpha-1,2-mannosidase